jgi:hypothetical protein
MWDSHQRAIQDGSPERILSILQAKVDAMIAIITDLTVDCVELFLQEPPYEESE